MTKQEISAEVKANLLAWFRRNVPYIGPDAEGRGYKSGRIGHVTYKRAGELDDICAGTGVDRQIWYMDAYERGIIDYQEKFQLDEMVFLLHNPLIACQLVLGITDRRGLRCYRRGLTEEIARLQRKVYRPRYYARENARRRALAAERRKIRRCTTTNPCPTPDELRAAFARRGESAEAKLRLGGMLEDLECYVDNTLIYDEHLQIVGRRGGVRGWLQRVAPDLAPHYKTLMAYKALAKRLRQGTGIADPLPTDAFLPEPSPVRDAVRGTSEDMVVCPASNTRQMEGGKEFSAADSHRRGGRDAVGAEATGTRGVARQGGFCGRRPRSMEEWKKWAEWQFRGSREHAEGVWRRRELSAEKVWQVLARCPNSLAELNRRVNHLLE